MSHLSLDFPKAFQFLFRPSRYKVSYGGRGAGRSWQFARALILLAHGNMQYMPNGRERIGCFRELQTSIKDSVHRLLRDQIYLLGLTPWFEITESSIRSILTGSEFLFKGLRHNAAEIKSTEGITKAWVEEAQLVSSDSWELLIPTIRQEGSEIWVTFNPDQETDATYQRFVVNTPPNAIVVKVSYRDNPWFPKTLNDEREWLLRSDPDAYENVWEGTCKTISEAIIFKKYDAETGKGNYVIDSFDDPPNGTRFHQGADFGFANDPTVLVRDWTTGRAPHEELWIDREAYGVGVEIDETPQLFDSIGPTARSWPIKADCARPETISYLHRAGFNITAAEKWPGCVEDRIAHLKGFKIIHVHPRCTHVLQEFRLYCYKTDRITKEVLPIVVDKNNHTTDSIGYSLDGYIMRRGAAGVWARL